MVISGPPLVLIGRLNTVSLLFSLPATSICKSANDDADQILDPDHSIPRRFCYDGQMVRTGVFTPFPYFEL